MHVLVVRRLAAEGHGVTVFDRVSAEANLPEGARHLRGDRRRLAEHADGLRRDALDAVLAGV